MSAKTSLVRLGLILLLLGVSTGCQSGSEPTADATLVPTWGPTRSPPPPPTQSAVPTDEPVAPTASASAPPSSPTPLPPPSETLVPPTATPTAKPAYPSLRQLTSGGCCVNPYWSADSREVLFIDNPPGRPLGIYAVDVTQPQTNIPALKTEQIDYTSDDGSLRAYLDGYQTVVERVATGETYPIDNGGRQVLFSPDNQRLLWLVTDRQGNFDRRDSQVWVANVDGSQATRVATIKRFGPVLWLDADRLLLSGLPGEDGELTLAVLRLRDGELVTLAQTGDDRGLIVSPGGGWLVYYLAFQDDPQDDGIWLVPTDGVNPPRRFPVFGSYRWRDEGHLLYIPMALGAPSHSLWQYDVVAEVGRPLTEPDSLSFKVANGDWQVSPDGRYVVFVNAADHNLWLIDLGP